MNSKTRCTPLFSDEDADLKLRSWRLDTKGYPVAGIMVRGKAVIIRAHRVVLGRILGRKPLPSQVADHANGNHLDARRENIRLTDRAGNAQNRCTIARHGFRGATLHKQSGKWQAQVGHFGRHYYLGLFNSPESAAAAAEQKRNELGFLRRAS